MLSTPVMWLLFAPLVYIGLKYKVYWKDNEICQEASGGPKVCIAYGEITRLALETSKPAELPSSSRPFRRIAIYGGNVGNFDSFIDVSLKHFVADDIRKLMRAIRARRSDLELPNDWL